MTSLCCGDFSPQAAGHVFVDPDGGGHNDPFCSSPLAIAPTTSPVIPDFTSRASRSERRRGFSLRRQLASLAPLAALWIVGLTLLFVARFQTVAPLRTLFLDATYLTGSPWYTGALSNLGILVWTSGAVFAVAGAWVARRIGRESAARFLAFGAAATLLLVLDDVFALHAGPLKHLLGGSKHLAQLFVVAPVGLWLAVFWADIRRTRSALLFAALGSLAGSVVVDVGIGLSGDTSLLVEDGMKFLGILAWSQYFAITSRDIAASAISGALSTHELASDGPTLARAATAEAVAENDRSVPEIPRAA